MHRLLLGGRAPSSGKPRTAELTEAESDTPSLGDAAYRQLRDDIVACRLLPGQRLTERALAVTTGFGISPVRAALTRLDHEGLVQTLPRKGYRVKPLTIKAITDLFDFWELFGPELARRGIEAASAESLAEIGAAFDAHLPSIGDNAGNSDSPMRIGGEIFELLAEATENDYLISTLQRLTNELERVWTLVMESDPRGPTAVVTSEVWRETIADRNGALVADAIRRYIQHSRDAVLRTLARWPSVITSEVVPFQHDKSS